MSDFHEFIKYHDMLARQEVDDRLYMIMDENDQPVRTTENTVYARDPLQCISGVLDALKVVPVTPVSNKVAIVAGHFYCGGELFIFPGAASVEIPIHPYLPTYIFVGLHIDKNTKEVTPWINTEYGVLPSYFPEVLPLALIHKRPDASEFLSDDIIDIRPFQNFDVTIPRDKLEVEIDCLGPGEAVSFSRRPYTGGAPFLQVWQRLGDGTTYDIVHDYRRPEDSLDHWRDFKPYKALWNEEHLHYNPATDGVSLNTLNRRLPVEFGNLPEVIFVSPLGRDTWNGTKSAPVATISQALSIAGAMPEKTTIWLDSGLYVCTSPLTFDRPITFVGRDPETVVIRFSSRGKLRFTYDASVASPVVFRTINMQFYGQIQFPDTQQAWIYGDSLEVFNCICSITSEASQCAPFFGAFSSLFFTNCIFHQEHPALNTVAKIWQDTMPSEFLGVQNSIYIGTWSHALQLGSTNIDVNVLDPLLEDIVQHKYRPDFGSPCIDAGSFTRVENDIDGSLPDIGLYGGKFAALADNSVYPIGTMAVFRWPVQTLFGPMITSMQEITDVVHKPANTEIYSAVSFNGGKTWVAWDIARAAWRLVQLDQLQTIGNTWEYIKEQLKRTDFTVYSEEIVVALGLWTMDPEQTPTVRLVEFHGNVDSTALTPYPMDQLDIFVNDTTVFIRNRLPGKVRGLVVVLR